MAWMKADQSGQFLPLFNTHKVVSNLRTNLMWTCQIFNKVDELGVGLGWHVACLMQQRTQCTSIFNFQKNTF